MTTVNLPEGDVKYVSGVYCNPDGQDISGWTIELAVGTEYASGGDWRTPDIRTPVNDAHGVPSCAELKLLIGDAYTPFVNSNVLWARVSDGVETDAQILAEVDIIYNQSYMGDPAIDLATRVMLQLTGNRWTWPLRYVEDRHTVPLRADFIHLVGRPVVNILDVVDSEGNTVAAELTNGFRLKIQHYGCCFAIPDLGFPILYWGNPLIDRMGQCPREITVKYVYGSAPPPDVQRAIDQLAAEIRKMDDDDSTCVLPERVTSVNRQGVSWTIIDPMDFIDKGRTGLYWPDLVIGMYGGVVKKRAKVYSDASMPPDRLVSRLATPLDVPTSDGVFILDGGGP